MTQAVPSVTTRAASGLTPTNATLNATVNPNLSATTVYFEYGPTTAYGHYSPHQYFGVRLGGCEVSGCGHHRLVRPVHQSFPSYRPKQRRKDFRRRLDLRHPFWSTAHSETYVSRAKKNVVLLAEIVVPGEGLQVSELFQVARPFVADSPGDRAESPGFASMSHRL